MLKFVSSHAVFMIEQTDLKDKGHLYKITLFETMLCVKYFSWMNSVAQKCRLYNFTRIQNDQVKITK